MNLEQAIKDEVEKFKDDVEKIDYPPHDMVLDEDAVKKFLNTALHSIAIATADALKTRVAMEPTHPSENSPDIYGNARIEAYKNGYNSAISESRQREKEWFGIEAETP